MRRLAASLLVAWVAFFALVLCASSALAASPVDGMYKRSYSATSGVWSSTDDAACSSLIAVLNAASANNYFAIEAPPCSLEQRRKSDGGYITSVNTQVQSSAGCADGSNPDTSKPLSQQCKDPAPACGYGQMLVNGSCGPICPTGQHYGRTALTPFEVSSCMDNCPANTFDTTAPGKLSVCAPTPPKDTEAPVKKTCDAGFSIVGFNGDGSAQCVPKPIPPDPCPKGSHNISADISSPNCTSDTPAKENNVTSAPTANPDGSTTKTKTETVTNPNGTTETRTTVTTTKPDGSETQTVTYSGTGNGSATAGGAGTGTAANGGGGGGGGNGSGGAGEKGDGVSQGPDTFFDKKDKTFSASITAFKTAVTGAPIVSGANTFLKGTVSSGGCFNGVVAIPFLKTSVDFAQYLCGSNVSQVLQVMAIGLMIGAAFVAFRMGFL